MELVRNVSPIPQAIPGRGLALPGEALEVSRQEADSLTRSPAWERVSAAHQKPESNPPTMVVDQEQEE